MKKNIKKVIVVMLAVCCILSSLFTNSTLGAVDDERLKDSIALYIGSPHSLVKDKEVLVDKDNIDVIPIIENSRTLLPVRFLAESLGAEINWDGVTKTVVVKYDGILITLVIGEKKMLVDNDEIELDTAPKIQNGRTLLPARAVSEAFDKEVFYDRKLVLIINKNVNFNLEEDKENINDIIERLSVLPIVGTKQSLFTILKKSYENRDERYNISSINEIDLGITTGESTEETINYNKENDSQAEVGADYSGTNIQVDGVDESDVIKSDGEYIYQINEYKVRVLKAYPAEDMKKVYEIDFQKEDEGFYPNEMYVDNKRLVIIGNTYKSFDGSSTIMKYDNMPYYNSSFVRVYSYNIEDKENITLARKIDLEGYMVSSRKIDNMLYLISNKNLFEYQYYYETDGLTEDGIYIPKYKDSAVGDEYKNVSLDKMYYFPNSLSSNSMNILAVDINNDSKEVNINSYLGSSDNVYMSKDNMYIVYNNYEFNTFAENGVSSSSENTNIYRFRFVGKDTKFEAKGQVSGRILNQFSMDEYKKNFRIATTSFSEGVSKNNVFVLNEDLEIRSKIEDIANGERIYSARFTGSKGYLVTFRNIDPLFVLDLENPDDIKILGYLKVPGYSNYLHPYDENHVIGIGKDTMVVKGTPYYLGVKMTLFDVSDVENPVEKFTEIIGDRGTESNVLYNHKGFLFSKSKNLIAFPLTLAEVKGDLMEEEGNYPKTGSVNFQGVYVYNIDVDKGFELRKKITHLTDDEIAKMGNYYYFGGSYIDRALYIENNLYTISKSYLQCNSLEDYEIINKVNIIE